MQDLQMKSWIFHFQAIVLKKGGCTQELSAKQLHFMLKSSNDDQCYCN